MKSSKLPRKSDSWRTRGRQSLSQSFLRKTGTLLFCLILLGLLQVVGVGVRAEEDCNLLCLEGRIGDLQNELQLSQAATEPLEAEVDRLEGQIASITRQLAAAAAKVDELEESIEQREEDLSFQYALLAARVRSYYKR